MDKSKFTLHYNFCIKHITKCPYCSEPHPLDELQQHIDEAQGSE